MNLIAHAYYSFMQTEPIQEERKHGTDALSKLAIEFFTVCTTLAEMAILYSKELTTAKKLPPVGLNLMQEIITGLGVQCLTI